MEFVFRKWDGRPHWVHQEILLGNDDFGTWIGQPQGWTSVRPGAAFEAESANVSVVVDGLGWVPTFFAWHPKGVQIYVDLVADLRLDRMTAIDMDLDVVLDKRGVWIDDEDEFAEHRIAMSYPAEVAQRVEDDAREVVRMIEAGEPPFDGRAAVWLAQVEAFSPRETGLG